MAKKFGENREVDFAAAKLMSFGKSFSRMNGQPLDESEVWYNLADLRTFAASDSAYVGMKVVYVDTANNKVYHYGIELNGELKEIGTSPIGDEKSITVAEDGTVSLYGIEGLALTREVEKDGETVTEKIKYQPLLVDGKLTWVEPSATTVEGLATQIAGLESTIGDLEYRYNGTSEMLVDYKEIEAKVNHMVDDWDFAYGSEDESGHTIFGVESLDNTTTKIVLPPVVSYSGVYYPATGIAESVFAGATALETIVIPGTVANIGANAFANCTVLKDVYFGGTKEEWEAVQVAEGNDVLDDATIHYNYDGTYNTLYNEVEAIDGKLNDAIDALDYSKVENVGDGKIKIDGEEVVVYAHPEKHAIADVEGLQDALDKVLEDAQQYADDNDANTTYTLGYESKVDGEGGHPARIVLTPSEGEAQYVDATPFIKDGMIESVALSDDGLKIVITWNTDSDKGENNVTELPLGELVDVYTGIDGTTVKVEVSNKNEISAEVKTGSIKDGHIASDAAIAKGKLAEDVQASLDLADSAVQEDDITDLREASHTHEFADSDVKDAIAKKHEHANQTLLDAITSGDITHWNQAYGAMHSHSNYDLLQGIDAKTISGWNTAAQMGHTHDNATVLEGITAEKVAAWDEAEKNVINDYDNTQFAVDENRKLTLLDIAQSKISGLTNAEGTAITLVDALDSKVDKVEGSRLITSDEASKLEKLVLGENGEVTVSGKVAAGNVDGLEAWITTRAGTLEGLSENNFTDTLLGKLNGIEAGAQVNVIEGITFNGVAVTVGEGKIADITYTLPIADADTLGGVKSSEVENGVKVNNDGTMTVNAINVNKLVQTTGEYLIMNGGGAVL